MSDRCKYPDCKAFSEHQDYCSSHTGSDWWQENGNRLGDRVVKMEKALARIEKKLDQMLDYLEPQFELTVEGLVKPIEPETPLNRPDLLRKEFDPD